MKTILILGDTESSRSKFVFDALKDSGEYEIIHRTHVTCRDSIGLNFDLAFIDEFVGKIPEESYAEDYWRNRQFELAKSAKPKKDYALLRKPKPYYRMKEKW